MPNNNLFTISYIGTIGKQRFLLELVDVVKEINNVHCIIAGSGSKKKYVDALKTKCSQIENVEFIGRIPMNEVIPSTKKSNVIICMFDPQDENSRVGLPNKVFESMVTGRPIIASKNVYLGKFVEGKNIGLSIPYNKKSLKDAIIKLRDDPSLCEKLGRNALAAALETYNWSVQENKLLSLYSGNDL
jgi:glycosyltransferase involved in cell wall biosynthesis